MGPNDWIVLEQNGIDRFAKATGDRRWIHVDPSRAAVQATPVTTIEVEGAAKSETSPVRLVESGGQLV